MSDFLSLLQATEYESQDEVSASDYEGSLREENIRLKAELEKVGII